VRRFDPIRMAVEHETLLQEKLRGGQLNDGKEVSVDVTILDPFLIPDGLSEREIDHLDAARRLPSRHTRRHNQQPVAPWHDVSNPLAWISHTGGV